MESEKKPLKKIKLKKEVIQKLEDNQSKHLLGGNFCPTGNRWTYCLDGNCPDTQTYTSCPTY